MHSLNSLEIEKNALSKLDVLTLNNIPVFNSFSCGEGSLKNCTVTIGSLNGGRLSNRLQLANILVFQ